MATLKISELSVGDWVRWKVYDKTYDLQVSGVTDRRIYGLHDGIEYSMLLTQICAIPITAEILEKNGLVKNGEYNEWSTGNWDDIPFIGISLSRQSMRIKNLGTDIFTDIFIENKVVYIHQLQHALRLAGVDKEINL